MVQKFIGKVSNGSWYLSINLFLIPGCRTDNGKLEIGVAKIILLIVSTAQSGFLKRRSFLGTVDYYVKQQNYSKDKAISENL